MVINIVWIVLIPLKQKTNLNYIKRYVKIKIFFNIFMPSEDSTILEFNQYEKTDEVAYIIYVDLECITEKIDGCNNNPENFSTVIVSENIWWVFSMSTISWFRSIESRRKYNEDN